MQSTFLTSLILSAILTPMFNSISFLINPRWQKKLTFIASIFSTIFSISIPVLLFRNPELVDLPLKLFDWIAIDGHHSLKLSAEFHVSMLSSFFLIMSNMLFTLLIFFKIKTPDDPDQGDPVLFCSAWAVGFSNLFLLSDNLYLSFGFLELVTLMVFLIGNLSQRSSSNSLFNRRLFLHLHFFNLVFLLTICFLQIHFQTSQISKLLAQQEILELLKQDAPSVLFMISFLLLASVAGRCGQFPFFAWSELLGRQTCLVSSIIQSVTLVPISFYFLFRLYPLLIQSPEACFLISLMGGITILFTSLISLFQENRQLSVSYLIAANWGIIFSGFVLSNSRMQGNLILFLLGSMPVVALLLLVTDSIDHSAKEDVDPLSSSQADFQLKAQKMGLFISVLYLFTGFSVLSVLVEPFGEALFNQFDSTVPANQEWSMFGFSPEKLMSAHYILLLVGQLFLSLAAFRLLFKHFHPAEKNSGNSNFQFGYFSVGTYLLLAISVWLAGNLIPSMVTENIVPEDQKFQPNFPFQGGLIQIISGMGAVIAWTLFYKKEKKQKTLSLKSGTIERICRNRFYIEDVIFLLFLLPIRGLGQLCRFFDWLVIDGILVTLPSQLIKRITWFYDPLESAEMPFPLISMLSAILVMFITLCWVVVSY